MLDSKKICVTTTAMYRPELLEKTYNSLVNKISWLNFKEIDLYINFDLFPNLSGIEKKEEVIEICYKYFSNVYFNFPESPSFSNAVKWCFSQVKSDFVLNVEDDWEFLYTIPISLLDYFKDEKIQQVGFRAWQISEPRFVLSPSILRGSFCNTVAKTIKFHENPEQSIRANNPFFHSLKESFLYWPFENDFVILRDLGREWLKTTTFARGEDDWTRWTYIRSPIIRKLQQNSLDQNSHINWEKLENN